MTQNVGSGQGRSQFEHHRVLPRRMSPGPGRRFDRRHWARISLLDNGAMLLVVALVVFWFGVELGLIPDVFGWHAMPKK